MRSHGTFMGVLIASLSLSSFLWCETARAQPDSPAARTAELNTYAGSVWTMETRDWSQPANDASNRTTTVSVFPPKVKIQLADWETAARSVSFEPIRMWAQHASGVDPWGHWTNEPVTTIVLPSSIPMADLVATVNEILTKRGRIVWEKAAGGTFEQAATKVTIPVLKAGTSILPELLKKSELGRANAKAATDKLELERLTREVESLKAAEQKSAGAFAELESAKKADEERIAGLVAEIESLRSETQRLQTDLAREAANAAREAAEAARLRLSPKQDTWFKGALENAFHDVADAWATLMEEHNRGPGAGANAGTVEGRVRSVGLTGKITTAIERGEHPPDAEDK